MTAIPSPQSSRSGMPPAHASAPVPGHDDQSACPSETKGTLSFWRFCVVGGVGFIVDAGVLSMLTYGFGAPPIAARFVSIPVAILVTWQLNRHWSATRRDASALRELGRYVGVQAAGALCNLLVYTAAILVLPAPLSTPLVALAGASVAALAVNYVGARLLVFGKASES